MISIRNIDPPSPAILAMAAKLKSDRRYTEDKYNRLPYLLGLWDVINSTEPVENVLDAIVASARQIDLETGCSAVLMAGRYDVGALYRQVLVSTKDGYLFDCTYTPVSGVSKYVNYKANLRKPLFISLFDDLLYIRNSHGQVEKRQVLQPNRYVITTHDGAGVLLGGLEKQEFPYLVVAGDLTQCS